jgi:hypothetical protein
MTDTTRELKEKIDKLSKDVTDWYTSIKASYTKLDDLIKNYEALKNECSKIKQKDNMSKLKELEEQLNTIKTDLQPKTGSLFVRLFLGRVNVKQYRKKDRLKLKEEYHKFRQRTDIFYMIAIFVQYFFLIENRFTEMLLLFWLLYYYITLCLRENILKVNGSNIKSWWIHHHLIALAVPFLMISWPRDEIYTVFIWKFIGIASCQSIVQIFQNKYQENRLYSEVAMGHASAMDVTGGEHNGNWLKDLRKMHLKWFLVLLPFLVCIQIAQLLLGFQLVKTYLETPSASYHTGFLGAIFLILGSGNLFTTARTYFEKAKK